MPHKDKYRSFDELRRYEDATAYEIVACPRPSEVLVLAPHGGKIEPGTSEVARAIAADDHGLYLFEGHKNACNYDTLHITSTRFDEPRCMEMVAAARTVVAIHGCLGKNTSGAYLGGLDLPLRNAFAAALRDAGFDAREENHPFPGTNPRNICNLGTRSGGVQIELTRGLRENLDLAAFAAVIRGVLAPAQPPTPPEE